MKIAVSTNEGGLQDGVAPVFGRCPTFTIVTVEEKNIKNANVVPNPGSRAGGGAGVAAAQAVIDAGVQAVITQNCGPNAMAVLKNAKIDVYISSGTVESAVKQLLSGNLNAIDAPSTPGFPGGRGFRRGGRGFGPGRGAGRW
ncbi:dinitrogenase iron-molybdenum cofactor [Candidatus Micrarchaeota archaeon]|nr:dinitrogenase iron-molybdenum cofactor [Candidatus Micrarchaeota archaeon]